MASGIHRLLRGVSVLNGSHYCDINWSMPKLETCIGESVGGNVDDRRERSGRDFVGGRTSLHKISVAFSKGAGTANPHSE